MLLLNAEHMIQKNGKHVHKVLDSNLLLIDEKTLMKSDEFLFGMMFLLTFAVGRYLSFNFNSVDAVLLIVLIILGVILSTVLGQFFPNEPMEKQASHFTHQKITNFSVSP